ncbi:hypothetical protein OAN94_03440 [Verrucomicrobiales bacterium]|jgi:hypothetical protein|nr:hypothetical protein [Verrucomicrobiales bacterium]MDC0503308.1 hypothetical protein [Verrucomicrobiales bacterium]
MCAVRLSGPLEYEQDLNLKCLRVDRAETTSFFTFADTVSARKFHNTNECYGWMGVRFQAHPRDETSNIIIRVRILNKTNAPQQ